MELKILKPRQFINPLLSKKIISATDFNNFSQAINWFAEEAEKQHIAKQSEPNIVTNALKPFLDKLGYTTNAHSQIGQSGMDLAILNGGKPSVIVEAKKFGSADMISESNLNKKAFHEAVLYFMRERHKNNNAIFHIIITDFFNWYVFDAKKFDKLFWQDKTINNIFQTLISPSLLGDRTKDFYQYLEKEIPKFKADLLTPEKLECAYFDIRKLSTDKERVAVCKLLGADMLLKEFNPNDANSLNKDFYSELLYILGLEESKEKNKKIIGRAKIPQPGSLYENASNKLKQYGKPHQFEDIIKLLIIWINRILFLKLLESQIVSWTDNKSYKFLMLSKVNDYDMLENMFFDILANEPSKRKNRNFDYIPYLNSSLFEPHRDERDGLYISSLSNDSKIKYFSKTVIKDVAGKKKTGDADLLTYLFEFLDAYNFSSEGGDEIATESKSLISASVLGLIFEKINGYKDGSYYTPSFVTMHMAKESIEKSVIAKFNNEKSWNCTNLVEVHNKINDIDEANQIINSLRICDPAVGSGHFLVSALNEILRIKSNLGILVDDKGLRIKDYSISVENDDLIIRSDEGELFEYKKNSVEKCRVQKTIFKEKQIIIENCLFGVDINPNSVNICRLRLWIELLKNAYYKTDGSLDTLPNIDINIKCGNSLISRFGLNGDLKSSGIKTQITEYKLKVHEYKENIGTKKNVLDAIDALKAGFKQALKEKLFVMSALNSELNKYVHLYGYDDLDKDLKHRAVNNNYVPHPQLFGNEINQAKKKKSLAKLVLLQAQLLEIEKGKIYQNAFEWRFEFPEVLGEDGRYIGFDIVIGNPPYILEDDNKAAFDGLHDHPCYQGKTDIWHLFTFQAIQICRPGGLISFIAKNQWLESKSASKMRRNIYDSTKIMSIFDFGSNMVFDEASQQTMIFELLKDSDKSQHIIKYRKLISKLNLDNIAELLDGDENPECIKQITKTIDKNYDENENLTFSENIDELVLSKIDTKKNYSFDLNKDITQGIIGGPDKAFTISSAELSALTDAEKKLVKKYHTSTDRFYTAECKVNLFYISESVSKQLNEANYPNLMAKLSLYKDKLLARREVVSGQKEWCQLWWERDESFFIDGPKIIWAKRTDGAKFTYTEKLFYGSANLFFIKSVAVNLKYIIGLLNSKMMYFYMHQRLKHTGNLLQIDKHQFAKIPICLPPEQYQKSISILVDKVLKNKQTNLSTDLIEQQIDVEICKIYELTYDEYKHIHPDSSIEMQIYSKSVT